MGLVLTTAPTSEPLTIAEVMAHLRLDSGNQEPAPAAPTAALVTPAAAGNVDTGAHRYLVTFVTGLGETQAGTASAAVTVADKAVNGKVLVSGVPLGGSAVTSRKIYRTLAGGSTYYLLATLADNTTTSYTDNIADASLGAGAPSANTTGDPMLSALIGAARRLAESETGRALVTQSWALKLDRFPCEEIEIPMPPLVTVDSIKYLDIDGVEQTLAASAYTVATSEQLAEVYPAYGTVWPSARAQCEAVTVDFTAGYGGPADVPLPIKQWMLICISGWYTYREQIVTGLSVADLPRGLWDALLDPYRVLRFE